MNPLLLLTLLLGAGGPPAEERPREPRLQLTSPRPGTARRTVQRVAGRVSDPRVTAVEVEVDGLRTLLRVDDGRFEARLPFAPGRRAIWVRSVGGEAELGDAVELRVEAPPDDLVVLLVWDDADADLDLQVTDPSGEACDQGHLQTRSGGRFAQDVRGGQGPELFIQPAGEPGAYRLWVATFDLGPRGRVQAEVQAWLHPGTPRARRLRFPLLLTREDERVEVGTVALDGVDE